MKRKIVNINQEKCNGCGLCIKACHEQAIVLNKDGKAELIKEDYCDGLGDCLSACPMDAITIEEREAAPYDEEAVKRRIAESQNSTSKLRQWPVQIQLVAPNAKYFDGANLLVAADCCAYAYGNFHNEFMKNKVTIVGCPKLDPVDYTEKLTEIIRENDIKSVTLTRMEVPCCGGLENAVKTALQNSGKFIPWQVVTISTEGEILD